MNETPSRRRFLGASGAAALLGLGMGPVRAQTSDPCGKYRSAQEDMERDEAAIEELEGELAAIESDVRDLMGEIYRRREAVSGPHPFEASTRERALQVGLDARPAVVFISGEDSTSSGSGTAWFVDDHLLMTNAHVADALDELDDVWAFTLNGERGSLEVVERVESGIPDVALLRSDLTAPATLSPTSSGSLSAGDPLVLVGNSAQYWPWAISLGAFEGREEQEDVEDLTSSIPSRDGASGSPIMTLDGTVVAMHYAGSPRSGDFENLRPVPTDDPVAQLPLRATSVHSHVPGEIVREKLEAWT